jgi:hypothetical protein
MQPLLEEYTARARGKKSVILALRYFSAAAGDALTFETSYIQPMHLQSSSYFLALLPGS